MNPNSRTNFVIGTYQIWKISHYESTKTGSAKKKPNESDKWQQVSDPKTLPGTSPPTVPHPCRQRTDGGIVNPGNQQLITARENLQEGTSLHSVETRGAGGVSSALGPFGFLLSREQTENQ
jgi:hypothetical protein